MMPDKTQGSLSEFGLQSSHLVPVMVSGPLVHKGEGLPADLGALTWGARAPLEDPPLRGEPPVEDGLKLRPLDGPQENHRLCNTVQQC